MRILSDILRYWPTFSAPATPADTAEVNPAVEKANRALSSWISALNEFEAKCPGPHAPDHMRDGVRPYSQESFAIAADAYFKVLHATRTLFDSLKPSARNEHASYAADNFFLVTFHNALYDAEKANNRPYDTATSHFAYNPLRAFATLQSDEYYFNNFRNALDVTLYTLPGIFAEGILKLDKTISEPAIARLVAGHKRMQDMYAALAHDLPYESDSLALKDLYSAWRKAADRLTADLRQPTELSLEDSAQSLIKLYKITKTLTGSLAELYKDDAARHQMFLNDHNAIGQSLAQMEAFMENHKTGLTDRQRKILRLEPLLAHVATAFETDRMQGYFPSIVNDAFLDLASQDIVELGEATIAVQNLRMFVGERLTNRLNAWNKAHPVPGGAA